MPIIQYAKLPTLQIAHMLILQYCTAVPKYLDIIPSVQHVNFPISKCVNSQYNSIVIYQYCNIPISYVIEKCQYLRTAPNCLAGI